MAWVQSASPSFRARHSSDSAADAARVLESLESVRTRLAGLFAHVPDELTVVLHDGVPGLLMAAPLLAVEWSTTAPGARRYVVGWAGREELHMLSPARQLTRASGLSQSREMLRASAACLLARRVIVASNRDLAPLMPALRVRRALRWAWLVEGAARWFGGQTAHARPAIARRLHEGPAPSFPPSRRDATLLGGTVIDLLAREQGVAAAVRFASRLDPRGPTAALDRAFGGRPVSETEAAWRSHLHRLTDAGSEGGTLDEPDAGPVTSPRRRAR
jgi:hypothetical protein